MPLYNYEPCNNEACSRTKEPFKAMGKMSESDKPAPCPECGELCPRLSNDWCRNFKLVGSGWFSTGYSTNAQQVSLEVDNRIARKNGGSGE